MERLIADAAKLDSSIQANDLSFGNIVKAINVVQTEMGITGTTALEAASTISGSVSSMKAAWSNFLTSLADGNGDYQDELSALLESVKTVAGNVFPVVKQVLLSITSALGDFLPAIAQEIPGLFDQLLPPLISAAVLLVENLAENLPQIIGSLISAIVHSAPMIISGITKAFSAIVKALPALIQMIADELPELVPQIIEGIAEMVVILVENLPAILSSLVNALVGLFAGAWDGIKEVFNLDKVGEFFADVWGGIQDAFGSVADWFGSVFSEAWEGVKNIFSTGGEIFSGITEGISDAFKTVVNAIISGINTIIAFPFEKINGFLNLIRNISFLGISPFKSLWPEDPLPIPQIPLLARGGVLERGQIGLLEGNGAEAVVPLENNKKWIAKVADDMGRELHGKNGGVNIVQNIYSQAKTAADLMQEALYEQQRAVLLGG